MPIIQLELKSALTDAEAEALGLETLEVVHASIGSAKAHINIIIRHAGGRRIIEAGGIHEDTP